MFGIFSLIAVCPLFWVICAILAVYFVLVFQVFTFEPDVSPLGCVRKSLSLIKGHFASTFMLIALVGALTYIFIPQVFVKLFDISGINNFFSGMLVPLIEQLPEINLEKYGLGIIPKSDIALFTVQTMLAQILIQYTLPLRSILWSMWYKELEKKPSEKLMEKSSDLKFLSRCKLV